MRDAVDLVIILEDPPEDTTEDEYLAAWQEMYDSGVWKSLQGWYGRTIENLLERGLIA